MGSRKGLVSTAFGDIFLGDCLVHMSTMQGDSVDLVFGSPPYEDARLYLEDGKDLGIALDTEAWVARMIKIVQACLRISKGLVALVVGHGKNGPSDWTAGPALLLADLKRQCVRLRNPAIYKRDGVAGSGGPDWLKANYEWVVCASKKRRLPWADNTACGHKPKCKPGGVTSQRGKTGERVNKKRVAYKQPDNVNPGLIINCPSGGGQMGSNIAHEGEAPFPEKLANFFIRSFCPPGGIVYDPFMDTGTTAAVAIKTGRKFLGSEIRHSQIKLIRRRVQQADLQKGFML